MRHGKAGKRTPHVVLTTLKCECGMTFPIFRRKGRQKKDGHVKHLWCVRCKTRTPHTEVKSEGGFIFGPDINTEIDM